mgnify:CR=1 FL=1
MKPGVFLVDPKYPNIKEQLPEKFKTWTFLYPEDLTENIDVTGMTDIDIRLASSRGMDINIISLEENTLVVNKRALGVKDILDKNELGLFLFQYQLILKLLLHMDLEVLIMLYL